MLLESDGQDLSHDDGGSSSLSSLIPAIISAQPNLLQSREWMEVVLCFSGGEGADEPGMLGYSSRPLNVNEALQLQNVNRRWEEL